MRSLEEPADVEIDVIDRSAKITQFLSIALFTGFRKTSFPGCKSVLLNVHIPALAKGEMPIETFEDAFLQHIDIPGP